MNKVLFCIFTDGRKVNRRCGHYKENRSDSLRDSEVQRDRDVVTLNRGSGYEDVVVTEQTYPVYQGAVVVCQGAGDSGVHLAVVQAVSVLTGLGSDKITVVQWK